MNRFLPLATLVASLLLASAPTSAQRLNVNPYVGLGFDVPADPDLCKVGTSGVDADARETAGNIAEASGSPPELEINNCHLHAVADSFVVSSGSASLCHPDHEPPDGNCGRPGWCVNPCIRLPAVGGGAGAGAGLGPEACGQTNCLRARCPVILTTYEVLAPSWTYTFPLDAANSHELVIDALHQRKSLRGNYTCTSYSTLPCPPPPPSTGGGNDGGGYTSGGGHDGYSGGHSSGGDSSSSGGSSDAPAPDVSGEYGGWGGGVDAHHGY